MNAQTEPLTVANSFIDAINAGRLDRIGQLLAADHVFVEADGSELIGRDKVRQAWARYLDMVPDYRIDVEETFCRGETVVFLGTASGTFVRGGSPDPENHWSVPAAWKAVVEAERISLWQLYVDSHPLRRILDRLKPAGDHP
jgi:ketosteroid isomerase-like protein